jgi:hypothetical protein
MQNRLRSAAAHLAEQAQRLRPGGSSDDDSTEDDDEDDEELPALDVSGPAHDDLARLDEEDAAPIALDTDRSLFDLLRQIDPTPPVPLTAVHEVGFVSLLRRLGELSPTGLLEDSRARRVLDLIGDRLSIAVGPDGITVRSLLRRRHMPWKRVQCLTFVGRYDLIRGDGLAKLIEDIKASLFPIPGLSWLLKRVVGGIANWLEHRFFTPEQVDALREGAGKALIGVERRGRDIEFSGALLLVSLLAPGLSEAVEQEARQRGITVDVSDA